MRPASGRWAHFCQKRCRADVVSKGNFRAGFASGMRPTWHQYVIPGNAWSLSPDLGTALRGFEKAVCVHVHVATSNRSGRHTPAPLQKSPHGFRPVLADPSAADYWPRELFIEVSHPPFASTLGRISGSATAACARGTRPTALGDRQDSRRVAQSAERRARMRDGAVTVATVAGADGAMRTARRGYLRVSKPLR
eukprot:354212-Chlamydomonas_euryale.AAC.20